LKFKEYAHIKNVMLLLSLRSRSTVIDIRQSLSLSINNVGSQHAVYTHLNHSIYALFKHTQLIIRNTNSCAKRSTIQCCVLILSNQITGLLQPFYQVDI
jgi:hypothetical protein